MGQKIASFEELLQIKPAFVKVTQGDHTFYVCPSYDHIYSSDGIYGTSITSLKEFDGTVHGYMPLGDLRIGTMYTLEVASPEEVRDVTWSYYADPVLDDTGEKPRVLHLNVFSKKPAQNLQLP